MEQIKHGQHHGSQVMQVDYMPKQWEAIKHIILEEIQQITT